MNGCLWERSHDLRISYVNNEGHDSSCNIIEIGLTYIIELGYQIQLKKNYYTLFIEHA